MWRCTWCQTANPAGAPFCSRCQRPLAGQEQPPTAVPQEVSGYSMSGGVAVERVEVRRGPPTVAFVAAAAAVALVLLGVGLAFVLGQRGTSATAGSTTSTAQSARPSETTDTSVTVRSGSGAVPTSADQYPTSPGVVAITDPSPGTHLSAPTAVDVSVDIAARTAVSAVELLVDGTSVAAAKTAPVRWQHPAAGHHRLTVRVTIADGATITSDEVAVDVDDSAVATTSTTAPPQGEVRSTVPPAGCGVIVPSRLPDAGSYTSTYTFHIRPAPRRCSGGENVGVWPAAVRVHCYTHGDTIPAHGGAGGKATDDPNPNDVWLYADYGDRRGWVSDSVFLTSSARSEGAIQACEF